ncbi:MULTISPECIES: alpha/beta fold hydrolase [Streptomyces]|uniref:Alpha/beta hydrolase n=1 Tax=Streptomyces yangpuensis TaxID=1648182 RepID=A0ABY5Q1Z7_9ACTN|nr:MULTISPECIES: alpha/beta hydrolase [Streptomyces]MBZ9598662.1 alpha/beta hydrolase [Streptomyces erythrochromogenes]UUY50442.1 alpha/beta hydrolase [Streptomyces yangpuensis]
MSPSKPSIVFAHGLWADGSCYSKLIPVLQSEGHEVVSAQNPLDSLAGDVEAVHHALGRVGGPTLLVGHSWGGYVITAAGTDERVAGLVYIAALAPDAGETPQDLIGKFEPPPLFSHLDNEEGRIWISRDGISDFVGDLPEAEQRVVWATQGAPRAEVLGSTVEDPAWKSKPSWFLVTTQDRAVNPDLQRFAAQRMGATSVEVPSAHVPMLSRPEAVLDLIRTAAASL